MTAAAFTEWGSADFGLGDAEGVEVVDGGLQLARPVGVRAYRDPFGNRSAASFELARWVSPVVQPEFPVEELVASWRATTPAGSWIEVSGSGRRPDGSWSPAYVLGRWAEDTDTIHRTTVPGQRDDDAGVDCDVLVANPGRVFTAWRVGVTLFRAAGTTTSPVVRRLGAVVSTHPAKPAGRTPPEGRPVPPARAPVELAVPAYSQHVHRGDYPEFTGGADTWCSPTSTLMVLRYWGTGPQPDEYRWVSAEVPEPFVVHGVAGIYDWAYGAGNWSFNVAYAARYGLESYVTRLGSMDEAEGWVRAGVPLVAAVAFTADELSGAGYGTEGHLLVIRGFTETGDVIVNDPASHSQPSNDDVRTVYDRAELERAWLGAAGGLVYVIHPPGLHPALDPPSRHTSTSRPHTTTAGPCRGQTDPPTSLS